MKTGQSRFFRLLRKWQEIYTYQEGSVSMRNLLLIREGFINKSWVFLEQFNASFCMFNIYWSSKIVYIAQHIFLVIGYILLWNTKIKGEQNYLPGMVWRPRIELWIIPWVHFLYKKTQATGAIRQPAAAAEYRALLGASAPASFAASTASSTNVSTWTAKG